MAAYFKATVSNFLTMPAGEVAGALSQRLIQHFTGNYQEQLRAWQQQIALLQGAYRKPLEHFPSVGRWANVLKYPLLRLQRRPNSVTLVGQIVPVIEFKFGARRYEAHEARQLEDYALDLRDFHQASHRLTIVSMLCATGTPAVALPEQFWAIRGASQTRIDAGGTVIQHHAIGRDLGDWYAQLRRAHATSGTSVSWRTWESRLWKSRCRAGFSDHWERSADSTAINRPDCPSSPSWSSQDSLDQMSGQRPRKSFPIQV